MTENVADRESVAELKNKELMALHQEKKDLRVVLSTDEGVRVIARILSKGGLFSNPFTGNSQTFFNCGAQNLAQSLFSQINEYAPDKVRIVVKQTLEL